MILVIYECFKEIDMTKKYKYRTSLARVSPVTLKKKIWDTLKKFEEPRTEGVELNLNSMIFHAIKVTMYSNTYSVKIYQNSVEGKPLGMLEVDNVYILKLILDNIKDEFVEV